MPAKSKKRNRRINRKAIEFEQLEKRYLLAAAIWDAGGDKTSWSDRLNWAGDTIPTGIDDVQINSPLTRVTISQDTQVASLVADTALLVNGDAKLTIGGTSRVNGEFTLSPGSSLIVSGAGSTFSAVASAIISGANLSALAGGQISIPSATVYEHAGTANNLHRRLVADGLGSRIELNGLTSITGGTFYNSRIDLSATNGGTLDFASLTEVTDPIGGDQRYRQISATIDGATSVLQVPKLESIIDQSFDSVWSISNAGMIDAGALKAVEGTSIALASASVQLPKLKSFFSGRLDVASDGVLSVDNLASIDGSSLLVSGGSLLSLPGVKSYSHASTANSQHVFIQAKDANSRLELPNLVSVSGGTHYNSRIFVQAEAGGVVDLSKVKQIVDSVDGDTRYRSIDVSAKDAGSLVRLDELSYYSDESSYDFGYGLYSTVLAQASGEVRIPKLFTAKGVNLDVDGTGTVAVDQIERFTSGRVSIAGVDRTFSGLVDATDTDFIVVGGSVSLPELEVLRYGSLELNGGGRLSVPKLYDIDGSSILVSGGVTLTLPLVTTYNHASTANDQHRTLRAKDANSRLELPSLESITGGTHFNSRIFVQAEAGGVLDLSKVKQIVDSVDGDTRYRSIDVSAKDSGSLVRLDELSYYSDESSYDFGYGLYSTVLAQASGEVRIPRLFTAKGVNLDVDGTGTIAVDQIERFTSGRVSIAGVDRTFSSLVDATDTDFIVVGGSVSLPELEVLRHGSLTLNSGGRLSVPKLYDIDGSSILVSAGVTLTLPLVTTYNHASTANDEHRTLRAKDANSRLELPNLESITGGTHFNSRIFVQAEAGGVVDLSKVKQIVDSVDGDTRFRSIDVSAKGAESLVRLDELSYYSDESSYDFGYGLYSTVLAQASGEVRIPKLFTAKGVNLEFDGTGTVAVEQFQRFRSGRVSIVGVDRTFSGLVDATDTDFIVVGGSVSLPELEVLRYGILELDSGGRLSVPKLYDIDGSSILVSGGVTLTLPLVTTYNHTSSANDQHRTLRVQDANSRLELPNLESITGGTHYNSRIFLQAEAGGVLDLSKVKQIVDSVDGDTRFRSIDVSAKDAGSLVRLDELSYYSDESSYDFGYGLYSTVLAQASGEVRIPKLLFAKGVNLDVDGTGTIAVDQIQRFTSGRVSIIGVDRTFTSLVDAADTDFIVVGGSVSLPELEVLRYGSLELNSGGRLNVPKLYDIDGSSILVNAGVTLTLPLVTTYNHASTANDQHRTLRAQDANSRLELPNLESITGGTHYNSRIFVQAEAGGVLDLTKVKQIVDSVDGDTRYRSIDVSAKDAGSLVRLDELLNFIDRNGTSESSNSLYSFIRQTNSGVVIVSPNLYTVGVIQIGAGAEALGEDGETTHASGYGASVQNSAPRTAHWIGSGGNWSDPANWEGDLLPRERDSVVIQGLGATKTITIDIDVSVAGFTSDASITISASKKLFSAGRLELTSNLTMFASSRIELRGMDALLQVSGTATINGGNLLAASGATIRLPQVTEYLNTSTANDQHRTIRAEGVGSSIDLSGVTSIGGGTHYNSRLFVQSVNGGKINLSNTLSISDPSSGDSRYRSIDVSAEGSGSMVQLDSLVSYSDESSYDYGYGLYSTLTAKQGGEVRTPQLKTLKGVNLVLDGTGVMSHSQVESFTNGRLEIVDGKTWSFPVLTDGTDTDIVIQRGLGQFPVMSTLQFGSVRLTGRGQVSLPAVTNINGASLYAGPASTISLPNVTEYLHASTANDQYRTIRAEGVGSSIDLSGLTSIGGGTHYNSRLFVQSLNGGKINLSNTLSISDPSSGDSRYRSIDVSAEGSGSMVQLDSLLSYSDESSYDYGYGLYSTLTAKQGGEVQTPQLKTLKGVNLVLDGTGVMSHSQVESFTNGRLEIVDGKTWSFPVLTDGTGTDIVIQRGLGQFPAMSTLQFGSVRLTGRGQVSLPAVANINGASLYAGPASTISLPNVTEYLHTSTANDQHRTIRAEGVGSSIDLSGVTSIGGGTHYNSRLFVQSVNGGKINLSNTLSISDPSSGDSRYRSIDVSAEGSGSMVQLDSLVSYSDESSYDYGYGLYSTLTAKQGGEVRTPQLKTLKGVNLVLDGTGVISHSQVESFTNGRLEIVDGKTWSFPVLTDGTDTDIVIQRGLGQFPVMSTLQFGSVRLTGRGQVSLPAVTNINGASLYAGPASTISLPNVTEYLHASTANDQYRTIRAEGVGSSIDLSGVTSIGGGTHYSSRLFVQSVNGGKINLSNTLSISDPSSGDSRYRSIDVSAEGSGSMVQLDSLLSYSDESSYDYGYGLYSTLTAKQGGEVRTPQLKTLKGVNLVLDGTTTFDIAQITSSTYGRIELSGVAVSYTFSELIDATDTEIAVVHSLAFFPNMTTVTNGAIAVRNKAQISLPLLASIDGASFSATDGSVLTVPIATSYTQASNAANTYQHWLATGAGSRLIFPALTSITGGTAYNTRLYVDAISGAGIELPNVSSIVDVTEGDKRHRAFHLTVEGIDSRIDLSKLSELTDLSAGVTNGENRWSTVDVRYGGKLYLGAISRFNGVDVTLGKFGVINSANLIVGANSVLAGNGQVVGSVQSQGIVAPSGKMLITGDFSSSGTLGFSIGGLVPELEHDQLVVGGQIDLSGTVALVQTNSFTPKDGQSIRVATYASKTSNNPNYVGLDFGGDAEFSPEFASAALSFNVGFSSGPRVLSITPSDSTVYPVDSPFVEVLFSESIDPATFTLTDIKVTGPSGNTINPTQLQPVQGTTDTFRISLPAVGFVDGQYTLSLGPDIRDFVGNAMNQNQNQVNGEVGDAFTGSVTLRLPDLALSDVGFATSQFQFGDTFNVAWKVTNAGQAVTNAAWFDKILLSQDATASPDDLVLGDFAVGSDSPLASNGSYLRDKPITLPLDGLRAAGSYYILVVTDATAALAEKLETNNIVATAVNVTFPPTPDLTVTAFSTPQQGSAGESIGVSYTIRNSGELAAPATWRDSIYLSLDGSQTNTIFLNSFLRSTALAVGANYTESRNVVIPSVVDGDYRLLVRTDSGNEVVEGGREANNARFSDASISIRNADLVPKSLVAPVQATSGDTITVTWQTDNNGTGPTIGGWVDRIYVSNDTTYSGNDRLIGSFAHSSSLIASGKANVSLQVSLPDDLIGTYYLIVFADALGQVVEPTKETNNTTAKVITVNLAPYADLVVSNLNAPAQTIGDPASVAVAWTVANHGTGVGRVTTWTDSIVASSNSILGDGDDIVLGSFVRSGALSLGQSYTRSENILLPPAFSGRYQLFVKADAKNEVFENGNEANNVATLSQPFDVMPIPYADLIVTRVEAVSSASTGNELQVRWTAENRGIGQTSTGNWSDSLVLTSDPQGKNPITSILEVGHFGFLAPGGKYERTFSIAVPNDAPQTVYAFVGAADSAIRGNSSPFEFIYNTNNISSSLPIPVTASPSPDLVVTSILNPSQSVEGSLIDVTWSVKNAGEAVATGQWVDRVVLRQVGVNLPAEYVLGSFSQSTPVAAGLSYTRTERVRIPTAVQGVFELVIVTNANSTLFERGTASQNNRSTSTTTLQVGINPRPDLQVDPASIQAPVQIDGGGVLTVGFEVINQGAVPTSGAHWRDRVYLSLDNKLSQDDRLLGDMENVTALGLGDRYRTQTDTVTIPIRYRGNVFLLLIADAAGQVDEWPNDGNNLYAYPLLVVPQPLADLVVTSVSAPGQFSDGDTVQVGFTVENRGSGPTDTTQWTDTVWLTRDKNRPHPGQGDFLLKTLSHTGGLVRNASYDVTTSVAIPSGIDAGIWYITPWTDPYDAVAEDTLASNTNPDDPNQVDNNNYKARTVDVLAKLPDLQVTALSSVPSASGGDTLRINYTVENRGNAVAAKGWKDRIYLSDSMDPLAKESRALLLAEVSQPGNLLFGEGYTRSLDILLSPSASGRFIVVIPDAGLELKEVSETNNPRSSSIDVSPIPADLKVTAVSFEPDTISGETTLVRYTVTNVGSRPVWSGTKYWRDFLWVSADSEFIRSRASYMAEVTYQQQRLLNPGDSYEIVKTITLPQGASGDYYLHIHLNANNDRSPGSRPYDSRILLTDWWPADTGSNQAWIDYFERWAFEDPSNNLYTTAFPIEYREPDLRIDSLQIPASAKSGETVPISFTVQNVGNRQTRVGSWTDRVFISKDASLDSNDFELLSVSHNSLLNPGASYTVSTSVRLPDGIGGTFYILAYTDSAAYRDPNGQTPSDIGFYLTGTVFEANNPLAPWDLASNASRSLSRGRVFEFQQEGNNLAVQSLPVTLINPPDLKVTQVVAPSRVDRGQLVDILYTVNNAGGNTVADQSTWSDLIYLSRDPVLDLAADRYLGVIGHIDGLGAGKSYSNGFQFQIPTDLVGPWYVIVATDPVRRGVIGDVFEGAYELNNATATVQPLVIQLPPPSDLEVSGITPPLNASPGEPIAVSWTVKNNSAETAKGTWFDTLYLSKDSVWDPSDPIVGRTSYTGSLQPGQSYSRNVNTTLPAVIPGSYRFIVKTDVFDNIYEATSESNNTTVASDATSVTVQSLQLNAAHDTTLKSGQERLYRVEVTAGETLQVELELDDSNSAVELYVRHDDSPSGTTYDAIGQVIGNGKFSAQVPTTRPGTYYILIRGRSVSEAKRDMQVTARYLPLSITDVRSDLAGDGRFFTTTIRGAKFHSEASVSFERPGYAAFVPVDMRVIDATTIRAVFDFTDAPHGLYDVKVSNPDGDHVVVPYRFQIQDVIEPEVTVGIGGPRVILAGDSGLYSVAFQSLSNIDTPYVFYQIGVPSMGQNTNVYNLPYLDFSTNAQGQPTSDSLANIPWPDLDPVVNTTGYSLASGYLLDTEADGFSGFSFTTQTYPGMKEMADRNFEDFKRKLYAALPSLTGILDDGIQGLDNLIPGLGSAWQALGGIPGLLEKAFVPFQFNVVASATALTRDEFIDHALGQAEQLRLGILAVDDAPPALLALSADGQIFGELYLAALEQAGILRPADGIPPVRERAHLVSLMATLASGIIAGPAGQSVQVTGLLEFFDALRGWYGNDPDLRPEDELSPSRFTAPTFELFPPELTDANPVPALLSAEDLDLSAAAKTHFQTLRVYVPWVAWGARNSLPADYLITGITPHNEAPFQSVDLSRFLAGGLGNLGLATLVGPFTAESNGFVPVEQDLPYTVRFQNADTSPTSSAEARVIVKLEQQADPRTFRLGNIQLGTLPEIVVPDNQPSFQADYDFSTSHGFILRVSAGIDLASATASWLLQAIDPATGELIQDPTKGILPPNNAQGSGAAKVEFTVRAAEQVATGDILSMQANVLLNNAPPEETPTVRVRFDADRPTSEIEVEQSDNTFTLSWTAEDVAGGAGFSYVNLYTSEDGGPFRSIQSNLEDASGSITYVGRPGYTYRFISVAYDRAGNRQNVSLGGQVLDDQLDVNSADSINALPVDLGQAPRRFQIQLQIPCLPPQSVC